MSLTKVTYSMIQDSPADIVNYGADSTGVADSTSAIQAAINASDKVYFPAGTYKVTSTINLKEYSYLYGDGADATIINSSATGFTFELLNPVGGAEINAPKFFDLTITTTNSGIRLNSLTGGFTDDGTTQEYMMRPVIERCIIQGATTGYGVQWSKCFDGFIQNSKIYGFAYNVYFKGCDICQVSNNRISYTSNTLFTAEHSGSFGSQTLLSHNDMGGFTSTAQQAISSSDRDLIVKDNYIEVVATPALPCVINITGGYHVTISDNRIEAPAVYATNWLLVGSISNLTNLFDLYVTNNVTSSNAWGPAVFNGTYLGSKYYANSAYRQKITHFGNKSETGFPFNSIETQQEILPRNKYPWVITPSTPGLLNGDAGTTIYCSGDQFVFLPLSSYGSLCAFRDTSRQVNGNVTVSILAESKATGTQTFNYQILNGDETLGTAGTFSVTSTPTWFTASATSISDLLLKFWNGDTVNNHNVYVSQIVVEYT